jgi:CRP/FNR family transcriptional regulator
VSQDVHDALQASHFRGLPTEVLRELLKDAVRRPLPAGSIAHRELEAEQYVELVVTGVIRVFVTAPDGRTLTIRYCRQGELLGAMSLYTQGFAEPATKQALVDSCLLVLSAQRVRSLADRELRVAQALLVELSERATGFVNEIPRTTFTSMRQRVARQLLDLAAPGSDDDSSRELVVRMSQQGLADAVGSVREVVVRTLRQLRDDGVVRTERDHIVVLDPVRLTDVARWNTSH